MSQRNYKIVLSYFEFIPRVFVLFAFFQTWFFKDRWDSVSSKIWKLNQYFEWFTEKSSKVMGAFDVFFLQILHYKIIFKFGMEGKLSTEEYRKQYNTLSDELMAKCPLVPNVMRLVRHLSKHQIHLAICTSSTKDEFNAKMAVHKELLDLIPLIVSFFLYFVYEKLTSISKIVYKS